MSATGYTIPTKCPRCKGRVSQQCGDIPSCLGCGWEDYGMPIRSCLYLKGGLISPPEYSLLPTVERAYRAKKENQNVQTLRRRRQEF